MSSIIDVVPPVSSALEPSLVRFPPPRRFLATPLLRSREGDVSPFINGPSSISDNDPFEFDDELLVAVRGRIAGRGRSDGGIGLL